MAIPEHVEIARNGAEAIAEWRQGAKGQKLDLSNADLASIDLRGADLRHAILNGVDFSEADLRGVDFRRCSLENAKAPGAKFGRANLRYVRLQHATLNDAKFDHVDFGHTSLQFANLREANLDHAKLGHSKLGSANLTGSNLSYALLRRAGVSGTIFDQARFEGTIMIAIDLSLAQGLSKIRPAGPSSIDIDTILKSKARIPEGFLRGCGYDPRIQQVLVGTQEQRRSTVKQWEEEGNAIRLPSCFISYSTADQEFVDRLQQVLNVSGVDSWYAPRDGRWGASITKQIDKEISQRERVILICSESSLHESRWVQWELEKALSKQAQANKAVIFPIMIDDALMNWDHPNATALREILAGDFRGATEGGNFNNAMERLLEGLQET
jgi:hypothetical protein